MESPHVHTRYHRYNAFRHPVRIAWLLLFSPTSWCISIRFSFTQKIISLHLLYFVDCAFVEWKWYLFTFRWPKEYTRCSLIFATNPLQFQQALVYKSEKKSPTYFPNICGYFSQLVRSPENDRLFVFSRSLSFLHHLNSQCKWILNLMYFNSILNTPRLIHTDHTQHKTTAIEEMKCCKILVSNHNILESV